MAHSIRSVVAGCLLGIAAVSCAGEKVEPATPANADETAAPAGDIAQSVNTVALCDALESSSEIPIGCTFQYLGEEPTMVLRVPNEQVLAANLHGMLEDLVTPFCVSQNDARQPSGVVFAVATRARHFDCRTAQLGEWVELATEERQAITIGEACQAISQTDTHVSCEIMDLDGIPSMVVGFSDHAGVEDSVSTLLAQVAASFCQSAAEAQVQAGLVLLRDRSMAKTFSCSTGAASAWFNVRPQRKAPRPSRPPSASPPPPGETVLAGNGGWDLLRVH